MTTRKEKQPKRIMTEDELAAIQCLEHVGMPCGSWDKRFRRDALAYCLETGLISDRVSAQLWRLFIRYRRQISSTDKARLMKIAHEQSAPDFRKQQAAARDQARIEELHRKYAESFGAE